MDTLGLIGIGLLIVFGFLAFWKLNSNLFMVLGALSIMVGLEAPDILNGLYDTTPTGLTIGIILILFALLSIGIAFRLMFWREPEEVGGEE